MRRVILAVVGTIAGLVALLSFKSHVPSVPVAWGPGGLELLVSGEAVLVASDGSKATPMVPGSSSTSAT